MRRTNRWKISAPRASRPNVLPPRQDRARHITLKILEEALGAKFRIVTGYKSGSDQDLAIERGEVQCRAVSAASFLAREPFISWQKKGFIRILAQTGRKRNPKLAEVPTIYELMTRYQTPQAQQRLVAVLLGADHFGQYPAVAPPGTPADRVKILRQAYSRALMDRRLDRRSQAAQLEHRTYQRRRAANSGERKLSISRRCWSGGSENRSSGN